MLISSLAIFAFFHFPLLFLILSLFFYFLPAYLARNKANFSAILLLDLFLGWTFIGWIIALVWALSSEPQPQGTAPAQHVPANPPRPATSADFFCSTCGKRCTLGEHFCSACGAALPATQH